MKKIVTLLICLLPSKLPNIFLNLIGHNVAWSAKIGFSLIMSKKLILEKGASISHLNIIKNHELHLEKNSYIGKLNRIKGPFNIHLQEQAAIGNTNTIIRARMGIVYGASELKLGILTKITAGHHIDLTKSIHFGDYSTLAGKNSQMWTHGYVHDEAGSDRYRVDGGIIVGNNVYIGSSVLINPGITIHDAITVGGGACISKNLTEKGMYVSQPLRFMDKGYENIKANLRKVEGYDLVEEVYEK